MNMPDERTRWKYIREYGIPAAIGAVFATCTQQVVNWLFELPPYVSWSIIGSGAVLAVLISRISEIHQLIEKNAKLFLGVLVALAGFTTSLVAAPALVHGDAACPAPTELRLVTAPENMPELRERADRYVRENRVDGCPALRITVAAAPPPVHLKDAFENNWERREDRAGRPYARLYDLQPDAWVTTSSAEPAGLREDGIRLLGAGGSDLPVGQDQLVLAMSAHRKEELDAIMSNPGGEPLGEVLETLRDEMRMTIARPFPETSISALIGTGDVFRALRPTGQEARDLEQELVTQGLGADTVGSLLCAFDRLSAPGGPKVALLVPGHSVADFNTGRVDDCPGTGRRETLVAVRNREFSLLDHRYVPVTWPGQQHPGKQELVKHFGAWLARHRLFPNTPVTDSSPVDAKALTELRTELLDHVRRRLGLRVFLDTSGSADRPLRVQAAEALRGQSRILGPLDRVQVYGLSSEKERGPATLTEIAGRSDRDQLGAIAGRVEDAGFDGWDAPVSGGIRKLADEGDAVASPVLLLTDGRLFDNENGEGAAAAIGTALRETPAVSGLYVIVFGQNRCAVTDLPDRDVRYRCVQAGGEVAETITRAVITMRGWR